MQDNTSIFQEVSYSSINSMEFSTHGFFNKSSKFSTESQNFFKNSKKLHSDDRLNDFSHLINISFDSQESIETAYEKSLLEYDVQNTENILNIPQKKINITHALIPQWQQRVEIQKFKSKAKIQLIMKMKKLN
jgi:hypothetical protein